MSSKQFQTIKVLVPGSTAEISIIENEENKQFIKKSFIESKNSETIYNQEVEALQQLNHKNIVKLEKQEENSLIFEYCEKRDLFEYAQVEKFSEKLTKTYFSQLLNALQYMHEEKNLIHRDIKLENIFLDSEYQLKLGDFGFAEKDNKNFEDYKVVGTTTYMAPELNNEQNYVDMKKTDIFACGVVIFSLYLGFPPFASKATPSDPFYKFFCNGKLDKYWQFIERKKQITINEHFKDLMSQMLKYQNQDRISLQQILKHPWYLNTEECSQKEIFSEMEQRFNNIQF